MDKSRDTLWADVARVVSNRAATSLLQPISVILFARALGVSQQGILAILLTVAALGGQVCLMGLDIALTYSVASSPPSRSAALRGAFLGVSGAITVAGAVLFLSPEFLDWVGIKGIGSGVIRALLFFSLCAHAAMGLLVGFDNGIGRYDLILTGGLVQQSIFLLCALLITFAAIPVKGYMVFGMYTFSVFANCIVLARGLVWSESEGNRRENNWTFFRQYRLALPHYASVISSNIVMRADILLIGSMMGSTAVGAYSVAKAGAEFVSLIARAVSPLVTAKVAKGVQASELASLYKSVLVLSLLGVLFCWFFANPGISLLLGKPYLGAVPFLRILVIASALSGICGMVAHHLYGLGNSFIRLVSAVVSMAVALPLMIITVKMLHPQGVALSIAAGGAAGLLVLLKALRNHLNGDLRELMLPRRADAAMFFKWSRHMRDRMMSLKPVEASEQRSARGE
jgi:O-antigen/teichoic acid export membrane protein